MLNPPKKLLDLVRAAIRTKRYSYRTEQSYVDWIKRYVLFHNKCHPSEMGAAEIRAFISFLANDRQVSASTQNQALSAILFLYRIVLQQEIQMTKQTQTKRQHIDESVLQLDKCKAAKTPGVES